MNQAGNGQPFLASCYYGNLRLCGHCSHPCHSGCRASCRSPCVWSRRWRVCAGVEEVWSIIAGDGPTRKRTAEAAEASMIRWEGAGHAEAKNAFPSFSVLSPIYLQFLLALEHKRARAAEFLKHLFTLFQPPDPPQKNPIECLWHWLIIFPMLMMNPGCCAGWESTPLWATSHIRSTRVILMNVVKFCTHYLSKHGTFVGCLKLTGFWYVSVLLPKENYRVGYKVVIMNRKKPRVGGEYITELQKVN